MLRRGNALVTLVVASLMLVALAPVPSVAAQNGPGTEVPFQPRLLAGGPVRVKASGANTDVRWILPGPRELGPEVFGTPDLPLGFEDDVGVPLDARLTNEDGTAYTTTAGPTPFSDKFAEIEGTFGMEVVDATLMDGPTTEDRVDFVASFTGPDGKQRTVKVLKVIPKGPDHPFLGGVGTNFIQHGGTGIGTKLMPRVSAYVAFWGVAELSVDGEVVASNRVVHGMITNRTRDENYELVFNDGVDDGRVHFHLMMPNVEVTPEGPQESPVPTGFELPNGQEQPFFHIMYEDVSISPALVATGEAAPAVLPESGGVTTPWLAISLVGMGALVLLAGLFIAHRRRAQSVRMDE